MSLGALPWLGGQQEPKRARVEEGDPGGGTSNAEAPGRTRLGAVRGQRRGGTRCRHLRGQDHTPAWQAGGLASSDSNREPRASSKQGTHRLISM